MHLLAHTTKHRLAAALLNGASLHNLAGEQLFKSVLAVEKEDGSAKSWNVTGYVHKPHAPQRPEATEHEALYQKQTKCIRTVD